MSSTYTKDQEMIIHKAADVFGNDYSIEDYSDDRQRNSAHVLMCDDSPREGVTSYATIGGYHCPTGYTVGGTPLRIEIVAACQSSFTIFPTILAACVYHMMKSHVSIFPGAIYKDIIHMIDDKFHMQHILLIPPFLWESLSTIELDDKKVTWLQAVPISEKERTFALEHGVDSLLSRFDDAQVNVFNLERRSVL
ncbi:suppressor of fused domain protein [Bacillus sp. CGMCC 1.16541]|uniref:suppressor of fused domain protein n=1 Tax=Bacillus sp. CGMCC 1.16541 TaxID=2185143 RepID=UPI000D73CEC1|nr:suppressor of fused domain protein [Bacillus sp. CGMCC 1.16541]